VDKHSARHGTLAHGLFGWCAVGPGRSALDELQEWRDRGFALVVRGVRPLPATEAQK